MGNLYKKRLISKKDLNKLRLSCILKVSSEGKPEVSGSNPVVFEPTLLYTGFLHCCTDVEPP